MQTVELSEWGADLSGRTLGEEIRRSITARTEVVFDCSGVESMSPSFADEVFGKLSVDISRPGSIRVISATPEIIAVIRFAVGERAKPDERKP